MVDTKIDTNEPWIKGLVRATQDAVIFIDAEAKIIVFNPSAERIFMYEAIEVLGRKVSCLMAEPYASEHDSYIHRYEQTGKPNAIGKIRSVEARRKNGDVFPIELSVTEVKIGETVRYGAFIRDVTEKVALQNEIMEQKRLAAVGTTAASLAHEVGNPLNNMLLHLQLASKRMQQMKIQDEPLEHSLSLVSDEIQRLGGLLEEFRMLSRRQRLRLGDTDMHALIEQICADHRSEFGQKNISIWTQIQEDLPIIQADAAKLTQLLINLCKNACEAMPEGGEIRVVAKCVEDTVVVEVHDSGAGIPEGMDVFEPFNTTKEYGTGLGLPIARGIAKQHHGSLMFRSKKNQGTVFELTLPVG